LRKLIRTFASTRHNNNVWPIVLLLFAVLVPAVCLVWFMGAAMRNERFAARQKLADAYRAQLSDTQVQLERHWKETVSELENLARKNPASAAFAKCVQSGRVDSVVIFDEQGRVLYPNAPTTFDRFSSELELPWAEANHLEYSRKDFIAAASRYEAISKETTNVNITARALQAQARCLVQAGRTDAVIQLIDEVLSMERYDHATDPQGRLIAGNAELMVLELLTNNASPVFVSTARRLQQRLMDYANPALASPQRRFLMKELRRLAPEIEFPTLNAEELAAGIREHVPTLARDSALQSASLPGLWQFSTPNRRVLALMRTESLLARLRPIIAGNHLPADAETMLLRPGADNASALVTLPAGAPFPNWQLVLSLKDPKFFDATSEHRTAVYLWTGLLVLAAMGVLTLLAVRILRRQMALVRLKNDLAATVSHELKTPLSSMRVLVDTLLDADKIEEQKAREYLQLIAQENDRLSRVIQNFLTFSRMERNKHTFDLVVEPPSRIIDATIDAVHERFAAPGCRFETQVEENLPDVMADADALATVLINLLDNAYKYSEAIKHIVLSVRAENGRVIFSVRDNGIGIPPRETRRIFHPFHQVDPRLSRQGSGCGLGLSIVQNIVKGHGGSVSVDSAPGRGSTFTISIPALPATSIRTKAMA
jgi:signal transduction histidine kinase